MEVTRPIALDRIGATGLDMLVEAQPSELQPLAARLNIPSVASLRCRFRLRRVGAAVIAAEGELDAVVTQLCVVSLEPFEQPVHETFALEFVPQGEETEDEDPDSVDQIPYAGRTLDLGEAAVEQLALALDPYPHGPEADGAVLPTETGGAFAALSTLRTKQ